MVFEEYNNIEQIPNTDVEKHAAESLFEAAYTPAPKSASDVGYWDHSGSDHAGYRGPTWAASQSEQNGFAAAQILMRPNPTAAQLREAERLILSSPNPAHAVWTANNGIPTEYGLFGIFADTRSDNLHRHGLNLTLIYSTVTIPAQGAPDQLLYRPAHTVRVPSGVSLRRR